jgi:type II secretory pathway component PulM
MKVNIRERKLLAVTLTVAVILLAYYYVVEPIVDSQRRIATELANSVIALDQSLLRVSRKPRLEQRLAQLEEEFNRLEAGLLPGDKAPLAAAKLQKIIKAIVKRQGVSIISEKVLEPVEMGTYQRIAVQVTVRCLVSKLKEIMYHIENNQTMLNVPKIDIKVVNRRRPKEVQAMMVVEGAIRLGES